MAGTDVDDAGAPPDSAGVDEQPINAKIAHVTTADNLLRRRPLAATMAQA
jgi:hypothetical protein